ncbi:hypothetical protein SDRG_13941 [Saprolegnia diclina VS20]|uniref:Uncharacterized protein n=1 Tax=Saprolegnia diclina (strain VS20) TaxID=1156394 RepID=T0Q4A0_SAPDV|nr:hypothetical protein SDRG_13941 [Saprolegnia diclina VS20]EQC28260.1 hypothetical protein SDRG_13941 [Saprolegnia diclina VS20]|eukprot:XP_008618264.1 hypothetical protein SDRG_13941 [Saprolegnia diclina VS20]
MTRRALTAHDLWRVIVSFQRGLSGAVREVRQLCDSVQFDYYVTDDTEYGGKEFSAILRPLPARFRSLPFFTKRLEPDCADTENLFLTFPHQEDQLPFHFAILEGHWRLIALFIASDAELVTPGSFLLAIAAGHLDVAQNLALANPSVVEPQVHFGSEMTNTYSAVCVAAANGHLEILHWLRASGHAIVWHALVAAATNGHDDVVDYLFTCELSTGSPDYTAVHWTPSHSMQTALTAALTRGHAGVVRRLLHHGPCTLKKTWVYFEWEATTIPGRGHVQALQHLVDAKVDWEALDASATAKLFYDYELYPTLVLDATDAEIVTAVRALPRTLHLQLLLAAARHETVEKLQSVLRGVLRADTTMALDQAAAIDEVLVNAIVDVDTASGMRSFLDRAGVDDAFLLQACGCGSLANVQWLFATLGAVGFAAAMAAAAGADRHDTVRWLHDAFHLNHVPVRVPDPVTADNCHIKANKLLDAGDIDALESLYASFSPHLSKRVDLSAARDQAARHGQKRLLRWIDIHGSGPRGTNAWRFWTRLVS